jgi:hypothetical protein
VKSDIPDGLCCKDSYLIFRFLHDSHALPRNRNRPLFFLPNPNHLIQPSSSCHIQSPRQRILWLVGDQVKPPNCLIENRLEPYRLAPNETLFHWWDSKVFAYFPGQGVTDFNVPWSRRPLVQCGIMPPGMSLACSENSQP